jgi:hypothetical protein
LALVWPDDRPWPALSCLELVTEAVRAALEELARTAGHALAGLVDDDWGRRYGRPVRLGKNPTRPKTRMNEAGADARRLLEHLAARCPDLLHGPQVRPCGQVTRWMGYLAHVTETCAEDGPNVITDLATMPATSDARQAVTRPSKALSQARTTWPSPGVPRHPRETGVCHVRLRQGPLLVGAVGAGPDLGLGS